MGYPNVSRPMGFIPAKPVGKVNAGVVPRPIPAVRGASAGGNASRDLAIGDAYALDANGNAHRAGPTDVVVGVCVGFRYLASQAVMNGQGPVSVDYSLNGQIDTLLGIEDGTTEFFVQSDTFAQSNVGGKFNLADAAPDGILSQSRQTINIGGGAGTQFQAQDIDMSLADNGYGANARVVVKMLTALE